MSYTEEIRQGLGNEKEGNKIKFLEMLRVLVNKGFVFFNTYRVQEFRDKYRRS